MDLAEFNRKRGISDGVSPRLVLLQAAASSSDGLAEQPGQKDAPASPATSTSHDSDADDAADPLAGSLLGHLIKPTVGRAPTAAGTGAAKSRASSKPSAGRKQPHTVPKPVAARPAQSRTAHDESANDATGGDNKLKGRGKGAKFPLDADDLWDFEGIPTKVAEFTQLQEEFASPRLTRWKCGSRRTARASALP